MAATANRFALLAPVDDDDDDDDDGKNERQRDTTTVVPPPPPPLATEDKKESSASRASSDYYKDQTYYLIMGNEDVVAFASRATTADVTGEPLSTSTMLSLNQSVSFFGKCFSCHYMSHSQKYCPLRLCKTCVTYGHAESVCHRQAARPLMLA